MLGGFGQHYSMDGFLRMSAQVGKDGSRNGSGDTTHFKWICVMCKTRQERKAEDNLKRQEFNVYLPMAPNRARRQGEVANNFRAMFPGYLFVEADLVHQDLSVIRSTLGCIALLRHGARPAVVPGQVMASIRQAEDVLNRCFEVKQGYRPGKKYELMEQGFHGHTATFLALDGKNRARVLVTLLNSQHKVTIPTSSLGQQLS